MAAKEVLVCQLTNGCTDSKGNINASCCQFIKNTTCEDLELYGANGEKWTQGTDYECANLNGKVVLKRILIENQAPRNLAFDPNTKTLTLDPIDNASGTSTEESIVVADLSAIWNDAVSLNQVMQLIHNESDNSLLVRVFTPYVLENGVNEEGKLKLTVPFMVTNPQHKFEFTINLSQLNTQVSSSADIFPNPFSEVLNVNLTLAISGEVYTLDLIKSNTSSLETVLHQNITFGSNQISTSDLSNGQYYAVIKNSGGAIVKSMIVFKQ